MSTVSTTWNPADISANIELSLANTKTKSTLANWWGARAAYAINIATEAGLYWEVATTNVTPGAGSKHLVGISKAGANFACGEDANGWGYHGCDGCASDGNKYNNNVLAAYGTGYGTTDDNIGVAVALGKIWFRLNGVWQNSGNPAAGTNPAYSGLTGTVYAHYSAYTVNDYGIIKSTVSELTYNDPFISGPSNLKTYMGVANASIGKINGVALSAIKKLNNVA